MGGLIVQIMVPVGLTHGFRWLGRRIGPRRGALLLGLPTTTAVMLNSFGMERGATEALGAAEASLLGLVAAALTPLVFARTLRAGWGLAGVLGSSIAGYLGLALLLGRLAGSGPALAVGVASIGLALAVYLASKIGGDDEPDADAPAELSPGSGGTGGRWSLELRTAIPVLMALGVRLAREVGGTAGAGLFLTFPATSLALLLTTRIENGPESARRLARAIPPGSLGMGAFLSVFLAVGGAVGPAVATGLGYLAATAALGAVEACGSGRFAAAASPLGRFRRGMAWRRLAYRKVKLLVLDARAEPLTRPRLLGGHRFARRAPFAPLVEALAG